ncbi:MAG: hypothetical protein WKG01_30650 [Kofleriaceae bacterium]
MTRRDLFAASLLALLASTSLAAPPKAAPANQFTVRIKMRDKAGKLTLVPIGDITRVNGKVTARGRKAPVLDKLADDFVREWKAYKFPPSVAVTQSVSSHTGMRPTYKDYTFTFTPKDKLYLPAVIRNFVAARGYDALGMSTIRFVTYDSTPEDPPDADDRASHHINIRKGDQLDDSAGFVSFYISARVRPISMGKPDGVLRVSASDPTLAVSQNQDAGTLDIAYMQVSKDRVEIKPVYSGAWFEQSWSSFGMYEETVGLIRSSKDYTTKVVPKNSPLLLEARIVGTLERGPFYDVTPVIDPVIFR